MVDGEAPRGPRGGRTTVTRSGLVRKSILLKEDEAAALRQRAYEERRTESSIVRDAVRAFFGLGPPDDDLEGP